MSTGTKTTETISPATKALAAATKATAEAFDAIRPATDDLADARSALAASETELMQSVVVKSPDPQAAKARIDAARAALKTREDEVQWCVLKLRAVEVQHDQANEAERTARRRVTVEEYVRASEAWNDPANRERALLQQLTEIIAELIPMIHARKALHSRLVQELDYIPADEKPTIPPGHGLMRYDFQRGDFSAQVPHAEVFDAINAGVGGR